MKLVLFDIDGTLVRDDGAAREAFAEGLDVVYGYQDDLARFDFSGKTDPAIAHEVLSSGGFEKEEINQGLPSLWFRYVEGLRHRLNRSRQRVLPGVHELLARLSERKDFTLGLVTGNIEPGARVKLAPWDLNRHFSWGAYGSDSKDRTLLPPIAVERVRRETGHCFAPRNVVIIGDSIWDVRCGVPHEATTIAVASGRTPAEDLLAENPDHFFESMEETDRWIEAIIGEGSG